MTDIDKLIRENTTEPYIVIQFGDPVPRLDGEPYVPSILSFGNGMNVVMAADAIVQCAISLLTERAEVHAYCDNPEHEHTNIREEMLHARR
jgi:hypothetical protein